MPATEHGLIATLAFALGFAFLGGFLAQKLRLPPVVGYLAAGIAVGPFSPGFVADPQLAGQLAEIGVVLLMFGVGIDFSLRDLMRVRHLAVPGALVQIGVVTGLASLLAAAWGWTPASGLVLGLSISIASTVVVVRGLADRGSLDTTAGHAAVGWLIVQDVVTVLVLVLLPAFAAVAGGAAPDPAGLAAVVGLTIAKVGGLAAVVVVVGTRVVPWGLAQVARTGSRELFTLGLLALAIGIAFGTSTLFGVSLALGAFLAGAAVSGSDVSHHAAAEALPLRDAFAVLFFVSIGMLFDPGLLLAEPVAAAAVLALVVAGNSLAGLVTVIALGHPLRTALTVAAGLGQVGEFAFIVSEAGRRLGLLPDEARGLVLAAAIASIALNPLLFRAVDPVERALGAWPPVRRLVERRAGALARAEAPPERRLRRHAVIVGHGRVGTLIADVLARRGFGFIVVDTDRRIVETLRDRGVPSLYGDGGNAEVLERAGVRDAALIVVATSDPVTARRAVENGRRLNPRIHVVARTHSEEEWAYLRAAGADVPIWAEREVAAAMAGQVLRRYGLTPQEVDAIVRGLRQRPEGPS